MTDKPPSPVVSMNWSAPATPHSDPLVSMVERLAHNPAVQIEHMERLLAARTGALLEQARIDYNEALAAAQAEMEPVRRDASNPQTRSRYASYGALDAAIRPAYSRHGFSVTFDTGEAAKPDHIRVLLAVARGAYQRDYHLDVPIVTKGIKGIDMMTLTHATMSAVTYGRRALLSMAFNVATIGDDDGNAAGGRLSPRDMSPITPEQLDELRGLIVKTGTDIARFCKHVQVDRLEDIVAHQLGFARSELQRKVKATEKTDGDADHTARDA